jgi:hypothetical protein
MSRVWLQQTQVVHNNTVAHSAHVNMTVQHNTLVQYTMELERRVDESEVLCAHQGQALQATDLQLQHLGNKLQDMTAQYHLGVCLSVCLVPERL